MSGDKAVATAENCVLHVVNLDSDTLPIAMAEFSFAHRSTLYGSTSPDQVTERIIDADIVITNKVRLAAEHLKGTSVRVIGVPAAGLDHLDMEYCQHQGIQVFNAAGYANQGVAEHALMMMMVLRRRLQEYQVAARDGRWSRSAQFCYFGTQIEDLGASTLGLIGCGGIGDALARMAEGLGMKILRAERRGAHNIRAGYTPFEETLARADIISVHLPLCPETAQMMNRDALARMKPSAYLINTGRGGLIDEQALLDALQQGGIAGAGLDVLSVEPPPKDHPLLCYQGDNLLITPHAAWLGQATLKRLVDILHAKIEQALIVGT